jgi:hypothetical protein
MKASGFEFSSLFITYNILPTNLYLLQDFISTKDGLVRIRIQEILQSQTDIQSINV